MSEEDTTAAAVDDAIPETPEERPITPTMDIYNQPERNLLELTIMADFIGFFVTLYMPWGTAAGNLASPNAYYTHLAERVRADMSDPNIPEGWDEVLNAFAERHFDPHADVKPSERIPNTWHDGFNLTSQLILQNAQCWVGSSIAPRVHDFLRVRLTDVTAWAWGPAT